MKQLTSNDVRRMFLEFFKEKGHMVEPSAPLVPIDDDSLLWINSGVATLKNILMAVSFQTTRKSLMHKNQFVQMTSKMLGIQHVTIRSLKC